METGLSCTRGFGYAACVSAAFFVLVATTQVPAVEVDVYSTSLRTGHNESGVPDRFKTSGGVVIENGRGHKQPGFLIREKPVEVEISRQIAMTPFILLSVAACVGFAFMTARMEQMSDAECFREPYSTDNPAVVGSSSVILWDSLFVAVVGVAHIVVIAVACTPCSWAGLALLWLVYFLPLAAIVQPKRATMHGGWTLGGGDPEVTPQLPACGVPVGVGGLAVLSIGAWMAINGLQYDPTGCRAQLLVVATAFDLLVLALGHLWDSPPSIDTALNSRLFYACCVAWGMFALLLASSKGAFPTEYIDAGGVIAV